MLLVVLLTTISLMSFSQKQEEIIDTRPLNNININLLGDASRVSINYERQFLVSTTFNLTSKLGLGYNQEYQLCLGGGCGPPDKYFTLPHHITGNLGKGRHFFEFGFGGTFLTGNKTLFYYIYPTIGYRISPLKSKKINFRIFGQVPLYKFDRLDQLNDFIFLPFGLSMGMSF